MLCIELILIPWFWRMKKVPKMVKRLLMAAVFVLVLASCSDNRPPVSGTQHKWGKPVLLKEETTFMQAQNRWDCELCGKFYVGYSAPMRADCPGKEK